MKRYTAQINVIDPKTNDTIFSTNIITDDNAGELTTEFFKSGVIEMAQYHVDRIVHTYGQLIVAITKYDVLDGTDMTPTTYNVIFKNNVIHWYKENGEEL